MQRKTYIVAALPQIVKLSIAIAEVIIVTVTKKYGSRYEKCNTCRYGTCAVQEMI